jgi:hypothetical protein
VGDSPGSYNYFKSYITKDYQFLDSEKLELNSPLMFASCLALGESLKLLGLSFFSYRWIHLTGLNEDGKGEQVKDPNDSVWRRTGAHGPSVLLFHLLSSCYWLLEVTSSTLPANALHPHFLTHQGAFSDLTWWGEGRTVYISVAVSCIPPYME